MSIRENVERVERTIVESAQKSGRTREDIKLLGVTKTVSAERIKEYYDLGYRAFGENRIQEYRDKRALLPDDAEWHIIGRLQKNKLKYIVGNVFLVHSLCSEDVAREAQRLLEIKDSTQDFLIEVNVTGELSKDGVSPKNLHDFIEKISIFDRIKIKGLMTIGRLSENPEDARACFKELKDIYDRLSSEKLSGVEMKYLSMGMSGDYRIAIEEGANIIRVGSAIFGERV